ncbi:MAG: HlyD family efflux transporter periplasmic adaptor subunit [Candidatus Paceibacterota bacterium]|jgi:multidrug resistance efflux pump
MTTHHEPDTTKEILAQEREILSEIKKEESLLQEEGKAIKRVERNVLVFVLLGIVLIAGAIGGGIYWYITSQRIYVDTAYVQAPLINLSPVHGGILQDMAVNIGDLVAANTVVAQVGNELVKTDIAGLIVQTVNQLGTNINPGQTVVTMVDPTQLRIVGRVDENKGLSTISVGDQALFTVDAFGGKNYQGIVDQISPTSRQSDIVFNISDQRPIEQFDVKIRYNIAAYPELKNGMSAKVWIYKH